MIVQQVLPRRRARERALQFLFGIDFTEYEEEPALSEFWEVNSTRSSARKYAEELIRGVFEHRTEIDEAILGAISNWRPERVGRVEKNILRVALFEMWYGRDVPQNVAINEAIEVAKRFGSDEAPRFVNGVLERLKGVRPRHSNT